MGICVLGILIGVVAVAFFRSQCVAEEKLYEYSVDDPNASGNGGIVGGGAGVAGAHNPYHATALTSVAASGSSSIPNGDIGQVRQWQ